MKNSRIRSKNKRIRLSTLLGLTLFFLFGYSIQSVAGSVYYSLSINAYVTVSSPTVILLNGTVGNSTIYTNNTSAKVSVESSGDFNHVLVVSENHNSSWKVRLNAYNQSNISRLLNCSIYIYDGSNSTQIVILNGTCVSETGPWFDLNALATEYIWMHVETENSGTSFVYVYLEIGVPDSTVYVRNIITFEIT